MLQAGDATWILIADGESGFRGEVSRMLSAEGCQCHGAADVHQTIALLHSSRYDLLIADAQLPGNGDLQLIRDAQQIAPGMPAILVSDSPSIASALEAFQLPVVAFLPKPLDQEALKTHVGIALQRARASRTLGRILRHLKDCVRDLEEIGEKPPETRGATRNEAAAVPPVTIRMLASCVSELLSVQAGWSRRDGNRSLCQLLHCPQRHVYHDALRDAVDVLERTKGMFKSREIGQLRIRLERLLEN